MGPEERGTPISMLGVLPQAPQMAPPPISPGVAFGSGVQAGMSGQGGNPYLQQQQQQFSQGQGQNLQMAGMAQQQQMQMMQMQQRAQQMEQTKTLREQELSFKVAGQLLNSDSQTAREVGARSMLSLNKMTGGPEIDALVGAMAKQKVTPEDFDKMLIKLEETKNPSTVQWIFPWATPQVIQQAQTSLQDPITRAKLGLKSDRDFKMQAIEDKAKEVDLVTKQVGAQYAPETMALHRQLNHGLDYSEGTDTSRDQAFQLAKLKVLEQAEKLETMKATIREGVQSRLQGQREVAAEGRAEQREERKVTAEDVKRTKIAEQKRIQQTAVAETFLKQFDEFIPRLAKEKFLPKGPGVMEMGRAAVKQGRVMIPGISQPNNPTWRAWLELQGNMVGWARSVQGEIGVRFKGAFEQAFRVSNDPPTAEGLREISKQMHRQLDSIKRGGPQDAFPTPVRIRDMATGRTGTLPAGESVPEGVEVIE